jgi:hypothetical protein
MEVYLFGIEFFFGAMEVFATLLFCLLLFRIPIKSYFLLLVCTSFGSSLGFLILYNYLNVPFLIGEIIFIIIVSLIISYFIGLRIWQSLILMSVGYLSGSYLVTGIVYLILSNLNIIDGQMISNTPEGLIDLMTVQIIYALLIFNLSIIFNRYQIGFVFTNRYQKEKPFLSLKVIKIFSITMSTLIFTLYLANLVIYNPNHYYAWKHILAISIIILCLIFVYLINIENIKKEYHQFQSRKH